MRTAYGLLLLACCSGVLNIRYEPKHSWQAEYPINCCQSISVGSEPTNRKVSNVYSTPIYLSVRDSNTATSTINATANHALNVMVLYPARVLKPRLLGLIRLALAAAL